MFRALAWFWIASFCLVGWSNDAHAQHGFTGHGHAPYAMHQGGYGYVQHGYHGHSTYGHNSYAGYSQYRYPSVGYVAYGNPQYRNSGSCIRSRPVIVQGHCHNR